MGKPNPLSCHTPAGKQRVAAIADEFHQELES